MSDNLSRSNIIEYDFYEGDSRDMYIFNDKFQMIGYFKERSIERVSSDKLTNEKKREVISNIYELVQPIIDAQTAPLINLQWLFNLLNYDRFN